MRASLIRISSRSKAISVMVHRLPVREMSAFRRDFLRQKMPSRRVSLDGTKGLS